jgi:hypothetical protein
VFLELNFEMTFGIDSQNIKILQNIQKLIKETFCELYRRLCFQRDNQLREFFSKMGEPILKVPKTDWSQ